MSSDPAITATVRGLLGYAEYRDDVATVVALVLLEHPDADPVSVADVVRTEISLKEN